ncbi:pectate lyase [Streptomyces mirabilis]
MIGGGAQNASDKVFQFNGAGKLTITGFHVEDFGKLARSCGNCKTRVRRTIVLSDLDATAPGKTLVGIDSNFGDTATLSRIRVTGDTRKKLTTCVRFKSNSSGKEPAELGTAADGTFCRFTSSDITYK